MCRRLFRQFYLYLNAGTVLQGADLYDRQRVVYPPWFGLGLTYSCDAEAIERDLNERVEATSFASQAESIIEENKFCDRETPKSERILHIAIPADELGSDLKIR